MAPTGIQCMRCSSSHFHGEEYPVPLENRSLFPREGGGASLIFLSLSYCLLIDIEFAAIM
jgi:hypothetical protein